MCPLFFISGHTLFYYIGALARPGAIQRKSFWKVAPLKHAQALKGRLRIRNWGCCADYSPQHCIPTACLAGSRSRSYRCPNFRLCCRHSHRYSNHPSMLINQTHHYHNYSPPDTSPPLQHATSLCSDVLTLSIFYSYSSFVSLCNVVCTLIQHTTVDKATLEGIDWDSLKLVQ